MKEYLIFDVGDRTLGLNVSHVQQVVNAATLSDPAPGSSAIEGLLNLRGQVVPILNLQSRLGIDQPPLCDADYLIIIHHGDEAVFGIRSNSGVQLTVAEEAGKQGSITDQTEGAIRVDSQLISLLNPDVLVAGVQWDVDQASKEHHE